LTEFGENFVNPQNHNFILGDNSAEGELFDELSLKD